MSLNTGFTDELCDTSKLHSIFFPQQVVVTIPTLTKLLYRFNKIYVVSINMAIINITIIAAADTSTISIIPEEMLIINFLSVSKLHFIQK